MEIVSDIFKLLLDFLLKLLTLFVDFAVDALNLVLEFARSIAALISG